MNAQILEWLLLLGRWLHITVGITWIGTSIFFMWLDRTLEFNEQSKREGHVGDLWMVHGGGFYHVEKLMMGPTKVPPMLHWFKWESYWTWMSGIFLLSMIFYGGSGTFLLDSTVSNITYGQAIALSLGSLVVSWLFYDFLWESTLTKKQPVIGHAVTLLWFAGMAYLLCHTLSGRAAYIHIGGMLGTWMTANVFLRIIPRQVKMVEAAKKGEPVNPDWAKNAKNRSTHNTYFTLPVIFLMLSNHFPSTYGNKWNWVILLLVSAAGAAIREFFVVRLKNPPRSKLFGAIGVALLLAVIFGFREDMGASQTTGDTHAAVATPAPAQAPAFSGPSGTIKGVVKFDGPDLKGDKMDLPMACSQGNGEMYNNDLLIHNGRVENVLVRVTEGWQDKKFDPPSQTPVALDQVRCLYHPRVIAVRVGQPVDIINSDATFHNVKSFSKNNEEFNLAMPSQNQHILRVFNKPEFWVQTKCSVHPWMSATIAVLEHPFFNVTNQQGEYKIALPPGTYTLQAWHERLGNQTRKVTVKENETLDVDFTFKKEGQ